MVNCTPKIFALTESWNQDSGDRCIEFSNAHDNQVISMVSKVVQQPATGMLDASRGDYFIQAEQKSSVIHC